MSEKQEPAKEQEPRTIGVIPHPPLAWQCECGNVELVVQREAVMAYMGGSNIGGIACSQCGVRVVLAHPQKSNILTPDKMNRQMRRAMANGRRQNNGSRR